MSKTIIFAIIIVVLLALGVAFPQASTGAVNWLFLFTAITAFRHEGNDFLWLAFFSGLALDLYSGGFFGTYAVSLLIVAFLINYTTRTLLSAEPSVTYVAAVISVSYLTFVGLAYIINSLGVQLQHSALPFSAVYLNRKIWLDIVLNLIFAAPVYYLSLISDRLIAYYQRNE